MTRVVAAHYRVVPGGADLEVLAEGRGEREPVADDATAAGRARNRRVEVILVRE